MDLGILSLGYLLHPSAEVDYFRNVLPRLDCIKKKKKVCSESLVAEGKRRFSCS